MLEELCAPEEREQLQAHLSADCLECRRTLEMWSLLLQQARNERSYQPSDKDVKLAKKAYKRKAKRLLALGPFESARIVFDSFLQPSMATVRSASQATRQLVYEAGALVIDVNLQTEVESSHTILLGQILSQEQPELSGSAIPVTLRSGSQELQRTAAGLQGEFEFLLRSEPDLNLWIEAPDHEPIYVPLPASST